MFLLGKGVKIKLNQKGMTLIEILVVMFILSLILVQLFAVMNANYMNLDKEIDSHETREKFRIYISFMMRDLVFANSYEIQNTDSIDILSYETKEGIFESIIFKEDGMYVIEHGKEELLVEGERYLEGEPMVEEVDGVIKFNFFARQVNSLLDLSIDPRIEN